MTRRKLEAALEAGRAIDCNEDDDAGSGDHGIGFEEVAEVCRVSYDEKRTGVYSLQYSPDAKQLVVGYGDGAIHALNSQTGVLEHELKSPLHGGLPIKCIRFHPTSPQVCFAASTAGKVHACNTRAGPATDICSEAGNETYSLDFSSKGSVFATAGRDSDIRIYETESNKLVRVYEGFRINRAEQNEMAHAKRVFSLKFHPEHENVIVTGGWDDHLKIWDLRTSVGVQRTVYGPHICGDGIDIKGPYILTASWVEEEALQVWDFSDGRMLYSIPFDKKSGEFLYAAQFCDHGTALAGGSGTGSVKAFNLRTYQVLGEVELGSPVQCLDSIRGGRQFAVGGAGQEIILAQML